MYYQVLQISAAAILPDSENKDRTVAVAQTWKQLNKFKIQQINIYCMQETKSNFIDEMRRKLNNYHVEKLRRIEEAHHNQDYFREQKIARQALIELEDTDPDIQPSQGLQDITGWNSTRPSTNSQEASHLRDRRSLVPRKNVADSLPSKTLGFQYQKRHKNPDMINYLKTLLTRLQSPVSTKRCLKTENIKRNEENGKSEENRKTKGSEGSQKRTCPNLNAKVTGKTVEAKEVRGERTKFQIIDLNAQNNPLSTQPARAVSQYQKIKRKSQNQLQVDIGRQRDILQQLIRGSSSGRSNYESQKTHRAADKFTLKNLLC